MTTERTLEEIKKLMAKGETAQADEALKELLVTEPTNLQAKMLYGTCLQLRGDQESFRRIHEELMPKMAAVSNEKTLGMWCKYHTLWMKLIVGGLVLAGAVGATYAIFGDQIKVFISAVMTPSLYAGPEYFELKQIESMPEGHERDRRRREFEGRRNACSNAIGVSIGGSEAE